MILKAGTHTTRLLDEQAIPDAFSHGGQLLPAQLVKLQPLARQLPLRKQKKVLNMMAGTHVSAIRGRGIDFSDVRQYQAGDDIRAMDWRVTARTGQAHIKVFQEEKERPVLLVCDLRSSLNFGTRRVLKRVLAADVCTLLGWAAANEGDRIGALMFDDHREIDLRPATGAKQVLHIINALSNMTQSSAPDASDRNNDLPSPQTRLEDISQHVRRIARPGTAVYFISDWQGWSKKAFRQLYEVTRHCDLTAIQVFDDMESELPPPGLYDLTDGHQKTQLNTHSSAARHAYHRAFTDFCEQISQDMRRLKVPLVPIATHDNPLSCLRQGLGLSSNQPSQRGNG